MNMKLHLLHVCCSSYFQCSLHLLAPAEEADSNSSCYSPSKLANYVFNNKLPRLVDLITIELNIGKLLNRYS